MREAIIKLAQMGMKRSHIAKKLQIPKREVLNVLCSLPSLHVQTEEDEEIVRDWEEETKRFHKEQKENYLQIYKRIYELYDSGQTMKQICEYLNHRNFRTSRNGHFQITTVFRILERRKKRGEQSSSNDITRCGSSGVYHSATNECH